MCPEPSEQLVDPVAARASKCTVYQQDTKMNFIGCVDQKFAVNVNLAETGSTGCPVAPLLSVEVGVRR